MMSDDEFTCTLTNSVGYPIEVLAYDPEGTEDERRRAIDLAKELTTGEWTFRDDLSDDDGDIKTSRMMMVVTPTTRANALNTWNFIQWSTYPRRMDHSISTGQSGNNVRYVRTRRRNTRQL
jgi:hypothetical protein